MHSSRFLAGIQPAVGWAIRVQVGADADLTIFDPATIVDHATFAEPFLPPAGIDHVLVSGVFVVRDGVLMDSSSPGQRVLVPRAEP